jgi:zinc/manganese transport system substrate-binding protein
VVGIVIPAPSGLAETNPAQLEQLVELIENEGVPAIFAETQHGDDDALAVARRLGDVEVVTLHTDSLGPEGSGAETYVDLLLTDAESIAGALA